MTTNAYSARQLRSMEIKVLHEVDFDVNCPSSQTFLENYSQAAFIKIPRVLTYASYLLDLALIKVKFLQFKTSNVAFCALYVALEREKMLSGPCFEAEMQSLNQIKIVEGLSDTTFAQCTRLFEKITRPS